MLRKRDYDVVISDQLNASINDTPTSQLQQDESQKS